MTLRRLGLPVFALLLYLTLTRFGWSSYPRVWVDEGWITEAAWTQARTGFLGTPSHGELYRYADRVYWMPPLYFLVQSGGIRMGLDPLFAGRWVSLFAGALGLLLVLVLGDRLLRERSGDISQDRLREREMGLWLLWLVLAFTLDPVMWKVHRSVRFESLTGLGILGAVAAAAALPGFLAGLLAGAAAGLAALTHPTGALALPIALGILYLRPGATRRRKRITLLAALGAFALLLLPFLIYVAQDRASGFANVLGQNTPHLAGRTAPLPAQWLGEWARYRSYFAWPALALPLLLWAGTLALALWNRAPRWLWWPLAVLLGGFACLPNKTELYLTLAAPFVYLLAVRTGSRIRRRGVIWAVAGVWLATLAAADVVLLRRDRGCRYREWTAPIVAALPPNTSVAGTYVTWFPVREHPYLEFHRRRAGDLALAQPDYVLWGGHHLEDPIFARLRRELGPFLAGHADTLAVTSSACYGTVTLVRPRWNELAPTIRSTWERFGEGDPAS